MANHLPEDPSKSLPKARYSYAWPILPEAENENWTFVQSSSPAPKKAGMEERRFRLAGTFFEFSQTANKSRMAIVDDLSTGRQHLVRESDEFDGIRVREIFSDHVTLNDGVKDFDLWLTFSGNAAEPSAGQTQTEGASSDKSFTGNGSIDKFGGQRIGKNRWIYKRDQLLNYYQELWDEPERLVKVFDSLKPLYDSKGRINGYRLGVEGEGDFFNSVGLKEGDVVREVNNLKMTSRHFVLS
jgi:type II secretory pathway component PulC